MNNSIFLKIITFLLTCSLTNIACPATICLTGKIELILPTYRTALVNAVKMAISQYPDIKNLRLKTYFYDTDPLSPSKTYTRMVQDHCSAIIGFEYLSDLLLVIKTQTNNKIPIFTSYASTSESEKFPENIFIFSPSYDYQAKQMMIFLHKRFNNIRNVLVITEINRSDLYRYKIAYTSILNREKIRYDSLDFIGNDDQFESKLKENVKKNQYKFVFVLASAVGSTKIINYLNNHETIFIGTENFGSSVNPSLYVRLDDKHVNAYIIRNLDYLMKNPLLDKFKKSYFKEYTLNPTPMSAYSYDSMAILLKTLQKSGSISTNNILSIEYNGITGASITNKKFHRSNEHVILSIKRNGFMYEE